MNTERKLLPARVIAHRLGVPMSWVKAEAEVGRLPSLRVGRTVLFDLDAVRETILRRAGEGSAAEAGEESEGHGDA